MCHATANQTVCRVSGCNLPIAIDEKRGIRHGYCSAKCARASGETIRSDRYFLPGEKEQVAAIKAKAAKKTPKPDTSEASSIFSFFKTLVDTVKVAEDRSRAMKAKEEEEELRKREANEKEARKQERKTQAPTANSTQQAQGPTPPHPSQVLEQSNGTREFSPLRLVWTPEVVSEEDIVLVRSTSRRG